MMRQDSLAPALERIDARTVRFDALAQEHRHRDVPVETPIAFEYDGIGYAVMMATPSDLEDYAVGFTLSERLVGAAQDIESIVPASLPRGWVLRVGLRGGAATALRERVRLRLTEGSCGLCGLETIEQVLRPLPPLSPPPKIASAAVARALALIGIHQSLGRATGAAHAAALCATDGTVTMIREDVGRHNALDKLIGGAARAGRNLRQGFILLTARCSYELVEKAATAGCPILVTISAPTNLAVERARECGLTLVVLARPDSMLVVNDPHGTFGY